MPVMEICSEYFGYIDKFTFHLCRSNDRACQYPTRAFMHPV
jgi:hypothetical protein